jgi:hypothetical protein
MTYDKHECDLMCERLAAYIEGDLPPAERDAAAQHFAECSSCAEALVELRAIAGEAAQLPLLTPSRDLWSGIESRISTPITLLGSAPSPATARRASRRHWQLALAASALIAVSAGVTYLIAARSGAAGPHTVSVATTTAAPPQDSQRTTAPVQQAEPAPVAPASGSFASHNKKEENVTRVYDREIALLDSLVHTRRESLDPKTVKIIERNLKIIDRAIAESRAALAKDPKSPLLTNRLDNVLGSKVELLRTVAFLPTQS